MLASAEGPGFSEPAIPWTTLPSGIRTGIPLVPSAKHGAQRSFPAKATVPRFEAAPPKAGEKGCAEGVSVAESPTYWVVQPSSPRVATYGSRPRLVGFQAPGMAPRWTP